ncbi:MAG TPA: hypothetical protein VK578_16420 [Edaphobacter sp.]|nr:hypothetical protein [Edaphobacter sp.]
MSISPEEDDFSLIYSKMTPEEHASLRKPQRDSPAFNWAGLVPSLDKKWPDTPSLVGYLLVRGITAALAKRQLMVDDFFSDAALMDLGWGRLRFGGALMETFGATHSKGDRLMLAVGKILRLVEHDASPYKGPDGIHAIVHIAQKLPKTDRATIDLVAAILASGKAAPEKKLGDTSANFRRLSEDVLGNMVCLMVVGEPFKSGAMVLSYAEFKTMTDIGTAKTFGSVSEMLDGLKANKVETSIEQLRAEGRFIPRDHPFALKYLYQRGSLVS